MDVFAPSVFAAGRASTGIRLAVAAAQFKLALGQCPALQVGEELLGVLHAHALSSPDHLEFAHKLASSEGAR